MIAIIITIMVLEMKVPASVEWAAMRPLVAVLSSYALSYVFLGIYWTNHHHLFQAVKHVNGAILWANLHLLFWLSLTPFVTRWMGETHFAEQAVASYGVVLLLAAIAYYILARALVRHHGQDSTIAIALGSDFKGKISLVVYLLAIALAFSWRWVSCALYVVVAVMWLVPDRRIERVLGMERH